MKIILPARFQTPFLKVALGCFLSCLAIIGLTLGLSARQSWQVQAVDAPAQQLVTTAAEPSAQSGRLSRSSSPAAGEWLQRGDRGPRIQQLNRQLQGLGYDITSPALQFSAATEKAVFSFQRDRGIGVDGIVGPETQAAISQAATARPSISIESTTVSERRIPTAAQLMPPDIQPILDRGQLVVAVLAKDNPPFFLSNAAGELLGSDVKIAQQLADQLGVELRFNREAQTFNEVVDEVYSHRADLAISKISRTLKRAQRVSFSAPYLSMRQGLLVNRLQFAEKAKGDDTAEMLRTLEGRIGVIRGSSYGGFAKQKFPKATVVEYPTWPDVVEAVTQGEVIAAYRDELEVKKIVLNNPDAALQFQTVALTDTTDPLAVVLPWDSRHLHDFVNQYFEDFNQDYTVDGLLQDYSDYL